MLHFVPFIEVHYILKYLQSIKIKYCVSNPNACLELCLSETDDDIVMYVPGLIIKLLPYAVYWYTSNALFFVLNILNNVTRICILFSSWMHLNNLHFY